MTKYIVEQRRREPVGIHVLCRQILMSVCTFRLEVQRIIISKNVKKRDKVTDIWIKYDRLSPQNQF